MRFTSLLCSLVLVALSATAALAASDLVAAGNRALAAGDATKALGYFKAAIIRDVTNDEAWAGYRAAAVADAGVAAPATVAPAAPVARVVPPAPVARSASPAPAAPVARLPHGAPAAPVAPAAPAAPVVIDLATLAGERPAPARTAAGPAAAPEAGSAETDKPWFGLTVFDDVDPSALKSSSRARRMFEEQQAKRRLAYRRRIDGTVEVIATVYSPLLYKYLAVNLGAEKGWSYGETQKNYVLMSKNCHEGIEFLVRLRNRAFPRSMPYIEDIGKRTFLLDDRGHRYEPVKVVPPSKEKLLKDDYYSVVFARTDAEGRDLTDVARHQLTLMIEGLEGTSHKATIPFSRELFTR